MCYKFIVCYIISYYIISYYAILYYIITVVYYIRCKQTSVPTPFPEAGERPCASRAAGCAPWPG